MKFTYLWPLALVVLIPVIIIMYMLKQKAKEEKVASLYLWREMVRNDRANTPWEKLKKNWLMILQIITLIVLIIAIMSPYFMSGLVSSGKACIVIDTSASMGFMYDDNQTRFDKAKDEAVNFVRKLKNGTEISVITSDRSSMLLSGKSQSKSEVIEMIKKLEVSNYPGDASEGVAMAKALALDNKGLETLIITDTSVDIQTLDATVVDVYSDVENVAIEYVSHGFKENELDVLVKVTNHGKEAVKRDVSLYQEDMLCANKEVELDPESSQVIYFEDVKLEGNVFFAQVSGKDACDYDNISYDVLNDEAEKRVLLMTKANVYLEKALSLIPGISLTKSEDIGSFQEFAKQEYDLYVFDSMLPEQLPSQGSVIIFGCDCSEIAQIDEVHENMIVKGVDSTTTKYLDGLSFGVARTYSYRVPSYAHSFLSVTDEDGSHDIAFVGENRGRTYAMLGFDLHNSDFPLYMEYPLLMYNLVNECIEGGIISSYVFNAGDAVSVNANMDGNMPVVTKPNEESIELTDFRYNYTDTGEFGIYKISQTVKDAENSSYFVVNYPVTESRIEMHPSLSVTDADKVVTEVKGVFNLRNFIIILTLVLLAAEWIFSLRR
ncbi:MAG: BatA and WFA domain-containing protein [Lachnospiraceae bacterium]|nr:BatA and WFA domain-containing protein [Lachnospiraceae bacterium]